MIFRGVPLPSIVFLLPVRTLDILFGGGGGGGGVDVVIGYYVCVFCLLLLVLVVCYLFSVFRILVVFCF